MSRQGKRRIYGGSFAAAALIVGAMMWFMRDDSQQQPEATTTPTVGFTTVTVTENTNEAELPAAAPVDDDEPMAAQQRGPDIRPLADLRPRIRVPDAGAARATRAARDWSFAEYQRKTANPDAINGETAWEAFNFARNCVGEPRTEQQFEFQLEQASEVYDSNRRRLSEERFNRYMDRLQNSYLRCQEFANADVVAVAAEWLQLSADLDYLPAQIGFYQRLPRLLRETQGRVFREPHYLDMHRVKSAEYLNRALESGHYQAFAEMARALRDGVVFDPDPVAALAYLTTADAIARSNDMDILNRKTALEDELSLGDVKLAAQWARGLCLRYCQLIPEQYESDIPVP